MPPACTPGYSQGYVSEQAQGGPAQGDVMGCGVHSSTAPSRDTAPTNQEASGSPVSTVLLRLRHGDVMEEAIGHGIKLCLQPWRLDWPQIPTRQSRGAKSCSLSATQIPQLPGNPMGFWGSVPGTRGRDHSVLALLQIHVVTMSQGKRERMKLY